MLNFNALCEEQIRNLLHQLNNDLSLIMGHVDLALRQAPECPKLAKKLDSIKRAATRMAGNVRDAQVQARSAAKKTALQDSAA
ncbi:MAG: hypothetical protein IT463_12125 [Planctomycetes bacterium]|nr:hypothetical protein [Planctomycetota bacterium]